MSVSFGIGGEVGGQEDGAEAAAQCGEAPQAPQGHQSAQSREEHLLAVISLRNHERITCRASADWHAQ